MNIKIYAIRFKGKVLYVGQTKNEIKKRFWKHLSNARTDRKYCPKLYNHMRKYNESDYDCVEIETCSHEQSEQREKYWIAHFKTFGQGCNVHPGGNQTRGEYHYLYKQVPIKAVEASKKARKGKKLSDECRQRMKESHRKNKKNSKTIKPIRCDQTGKEWLTLSECADYFGVKIGSILHRVKHKDIKYSRSKLEKYTFSFVNESDHIESEIRPTSKKAIGIYCHQNKKTYKSGRQACLELGILAPNLTKHLKGERSHVGGYTFEKT